MLRVDRGREPAPDRGVGGLPGPRRARRWSTTRSTSSTPTGPTRRTRSTACARPRPAARSGSRRATPTAATLPETWRASCARSARRSRRRAWASTRTTTPSARWPTRWPRWTRAPGWCRAPSTATASAAATPTWSRSRPRWRSRWATRCSPPGRLAELTALSHFVAETANLQPGPLGPVRRAQRLRPQGRDARGRRCCADPTTLRARRPRGGRQPRATCWSASCRAGARSWPRPASSAWTSTSPARATAILARLKDLEHAGLPLRGRRRVVRAAARARDRRATSRSSCWRASGSSPRSAPTGASRPRPRSSWSTTASGWWPRPRATAR